MAKTGTVYNTRAIGTALGRLHMNVEAGHLSARKYLGEPTGDYVLSTPTTWGVAFIRDLGPDGVDVYDAVDDMSAECLYRGLPSVRDAVGKMLGLSSFRIGSV
jgi:hypothetical protein